MNPYIKTFFFRDQGSLDDLHFEKTNLNLCVRAFLYDVRACSCSTQKFSRRSYTEASYSSLLFCSTSSAAWNRVIYHVLGNSSKVGDEESNFIPNAYRKNNVGIDPFLLVLRKKQKEEERQAAPTQRMLYSKQTEVSKPEKGEILAKNNQRNFQTRKSSVAA